jgi:isochorismatase family protein
MSENPNPITIDNSVLILIDHQPWVAFSVKSIDAGLLVNNLQGLAASAKALDVPTILTTVGAEGGILKDPLIKGLADAVPDVTPIDRVSTNAWEDIRGAVEATGRRTLLIAGLWTEVCLAQTAVSAIADGYRVFFARLLGRNERGGSRGRQAATRAGRRDAHQLGGDHLRVDPRLHNRGTHPRQSARHRTRLDGRSRRRISGRAD